MSDNDSVTRPPSKAGETDKGDPRIFARVPKPIHDRVDALRDEFPDTDGERASMSAVVRAFVIDGEPLMDPTLRAAMESVRVRLRIPTRAETWRLIIVEGLDALGSKK